MLTTDSPTEAVAAADGVGAVLDVQPPTRPAAPSEPSAPQSPAPRWETQTRVITRGGDRFSVAMNCEAFAELLDRTPDETRLRLERLIAGGSTSSPVWVRVGEISLFGPDGALS